jgi:hypothetical protein
MLAGLDLDMAYDATNFVKGWPVESASEQPGLEAAEFARLQQFEYVNLLDAIGGGDSSNGVPQVAKDVVHALTPSRVALAKSALYDTMVLTFRNAYEGGAAYATPVPFDAAYHAAAYKLASLALIVMADFAA